MPSQAEQILVVVEVRDSGPTRASLQLLGGARQLGTQRGLPAAAVLLGGTPAHAEALSAHAERVLWLQHPRLQPYEASRSLAALGHLLDSGLSPAVILAPASAFGLELLPRLAARCRTGYLSGCVDVWWEGEALAARRPLFGGRVYQEAAFQRAPAILTVRPGTFGKLEKLAEPGRCEILPLELPDALGAQLVGRARTSTAGQDISEAGRVVAGGRGMGAAENFEMLEELAGLLGGAVGASRAVVDAGLRPLDEQVGKSGKTISPELYLACGISGAIHHILGMNTSKVVVAINSDPEAPIFKQADYGLAGDALKVVPALSAALRSSRNEP